MTDLRFLLPGICCCCAVGGLAAADGVRATRITLFADILPDESSIEVRSGSLESVIDDSEWDDAFRVGINVSRQRLLSDEGGPLLTYGLSLSYSRFASEEGGEEFSGNSIMLTPQIGIGMHALEWLFLEGIAFAGGGISRFDYDNDTFDIDEESDGDFAYEYGVMAVATFAIGERFLLGARAGWLKIHQEGSFDGNAGLGIDNIDVESDTDGFFYGAMIGARF